MNRVWTQFFRSAYRKQPVSSFVLTVGAVNAAIGGVEGQWTLMALGLSTIAIALIWRGWLNLKRPSSPMQQSPIRYLPSRSSQQSLPLLTASRKRN